jgi:hypothetical protein
VLAHLDYIRYYQANLIPTFPRAHFSIRPIIVLFIMLLRYRGWLERERLNYPRLFDIIHILEGRCYLLYWRMTKILYEDSQITLYR